MCVSILDATLTDRLQVCMLIGWPKTEQPITGHDTVGGRIKIFYLPLYLLFKTDTHIYKNKVQHVLRYINSLTSRKTQMNFHKSFTLSRRSGLQVGCQNFSLSINIVYMYMHLSRSLFPHL